MAVGITARDHQTGAERIRRTRGRLARAAQTAALQFAAAADAGAVHAIAIHGAKARRQRAVMRLRLLRAATIAAGFVVFTQQSQLNHQRGDQRTIQFFPAAATQRTRKHHVAETGADQTTDRHADRFEHAADFPSSAPKAAKPSSSSMPSTSDWRCASSISPNTRTAYSRSVP
ncbi:hypothetical protein G6F22_017415 [Rhizopus arrhizus]|nr:hypothetical protein G6F22_017415 [Rhizopus arrhizus]